MPRSHTQKRLIANWLNIVLTIISVTQGVVIGNLLIQFPQTIASGSPIVFALFFFCLVISLRVFQTFITGVLDDEFTMPNLYEFFLVFIVVSIEYYLFSLFGKLQPNALPPDALLLSFHKWGMALCFVAVIGYSLELRQLKRRFKQHHKRPDEYYYTELWLQRRNILGMLVLMAIQFVLIFSSLGIFTFTIRGNRQIPFVGVMTAILFANIKYSLWATFGENVQMSRPATQVVKPVGENLDVKIVRATKEDVTELRNLIMLNFGYVYRALFCIDEKDEIFVSRMLDSTLNMWGGNHALGYKSFWIAHPKDRRSDIVGMLKLKSGAERWSGFMTALSIAILVLINSGFRSLFRVWHNWRDIRSSVSRRIGARELHITYLAVSEDAQKRQVGKQLLAHAREVAKNENKKLLTLCVRENNQQAKNFFLHQGFVIERLENKIDHKTDDRLGQGPIICMSETEDAPPESA